MIDIIIILLYWIWITCGAITSLLESKYKRLEPFDIFTNFILGPIKLICLIISDWLCKYSDKKREQKLDKDEW